MGRIPFTYLSMKDVLGRSGNASFLRSSNTTCTRAFSMCTWSTTVPMASSLWFVALCSCGFFGANCTHALAYWDTTSQAQLSRPLLFNFLKQPGLVQVGPIAQHSGRVIYWCCCYWLQLSGFHHGPPALNCCGFACYFGNGCLPVGLFIFPFSCVSTATKIRDSSFKKGIHVLDRLVWWSPVVVFETDSRNYLNFHRRGAVQLEVAGSRCHDKISYWNRRCDETARDF